MIKSGGIKNKIIYDIGSGDGRFIIEASKYASKAYGIEIEPLKWIFSSLRLKLNKINNARIFFGDFFNRSMRDADVVFIYLPQETVNKLVPKLKKLKRGTKVISHKSRCSGLKLIKELKPEKIYIYKV